MANRIRYYPTSINTSKTYPRQKYCLQGSPGMIVSDAREGKHLAADTSSKGCRLTQWIYLYLQTSGNGPFCLTTPAQLAPYVLFPARAPHPLPHCFPPRWTLLIRNGQSQDTGPHRILWWSPSMPPSSPVHYAHQGQLDWPCLYPLSHVVLQRLQDGLV